MDDDGAGDSVFPLPLWATILALVFSPVVWGQAPARPDIIEVVELKGEINSFMASAVATAVEKINENPKVKGVVLVVDSPGGGASASAVLYQELAKIKVPVVGFCEYICASGGVYALMAPSVKFIAVRDDTISGSVGVIMQQTRFNRLLDWAKIDNEVFKSGLLKDSGNPTRPATEADRAYLQGIVDTLAEKFYAVVRKSRPKADMKELATAKIFIGEQGVKVGLADAVMTREQAVAKAKELSGSKLAYTREELKKMSALANEPSAYGYRSEPMGMSDQLMAHLNYGVALVKEIRAGESVTFAYKMPYQF